MWRALALVVCFSAVGCDDEEKPYDLDAGASPALGAIYVKQRDCAMCHQSANAAFGTLSGQEQPRPGTGAFGANLTPDPGALGNWSDIQIIRAMRAGVDDALEPLCPPMPHYTDMTELEARSIVAYLRTLPPVHREDIGSSRCPPLKPFITDMTATPPNDDGGTP